MSWTVIKGPALLSVYKPKPPMAFQLLKLDVASKRIQLMSWAAVWCISCSSDTFAGIWNAHPDLTKMQAYSETPGIAQLDCWGVRGAVPLTCLPLEMCAEALLQLYTGLTFFPSYFMQPFIETNYRIFIPKAPWVGFVTRFDLSLNFCEVWWGFCFIPPNSETYYREVRYDQGLVAVW